jgi:predicted DNA-binding transcriptional regulator YafY
VDAAPQPRLARARPPAAQSQRGRRGRVPSQDVLAACLFRSSNQNHLAAPGARPVTARPASLETLIFTLELLRRIPRGRKVSASELHRQLADAGWERNLRTVQRQLDELSRHFDIERDDSSKPFGYQWKAQSPGLSVPGLGEKESLLLALAEQHLASLLPTEVMAGLQAFFEQARSNLRALDDGRAATRHAREWMRKVRVVSTSQPLLPPPLVPGVFDTLSHALYRDLWVRIDYRNSAGRTTEGEVMPLGLAQQGTRLYLVCRFRGYDNERSLALNRVISATALAETFRRPPGFDLAGYDNEGRFGFGAGKRIRLEIRIRKPAGMHLLESRLAADQAVREEADAYRITATVTDTEQLKWWLRGFGDDVEVLAPARLRQALRAPTRMT